MYEADWVFCRCCSSGFAFDGLLYRNSKLPKPTKYTKNTKAIFREFRGLSIKSQRPFYEEHTPFPSRKGKDNPQYPPLLKGIKVPSWAEIF